MYVCKGGNQQLAQKLAEAIGSERILLNTPANSVTIKENQVVVTGANGNTLTADDAILAIPPSVWSNIKFDPALPEGLRPQMASAVKYLMSLKNRFWLADKLSPDSGEQRQHSIYLGWSGGPGRRCAGCDGRLFQR